MKLIVRLRAVGWFFVAAGVLWLVWTALRMTYLGF